VAATSLKLPDELKRRLERLAANVQKSPHAFMVEVLTREAERAELRERFAAEAAAAQKKVLAGGKTISLARTFDYLERKLAGKKARRPQPRSWRASK
jgi:predicted transcriptional regulator